MALPQPSFPGSTRPCPHCKATILISAAVCPACQRYVRLDPDRLARLTSPIFCPLQVEGTIRHPGIAERCEYSVLVQVQNDQGEVISRHVVGVGSLGPTETRTFTIRVEVVTADKSVVRDL